jgi:Ca2+-binding RTX toxin-like protein
MSNYNNGVSIDLQPGKWSVTSPAQLAILDAQLTGAPGGITWFPAQGNVYNALLQNDDPRSLIEDAVGGAGADTITGNQADNRLTGGPGRDTFAFAGAFGHDRVLDFRQGEDVLRFLVPGVASTGDLTWRVVPDILPGDDFAPDLRPPPSPPGVLGTLIEAGGAGTVLLAGFGGMLREENFLFA